MWYNFEYNGLDIMTLILETGEVFERNFHWWMINQQPFTEFTYDYFLPEMSP